MSNSRVDSDGYRVVNPEFRFAIAEDGPRRKRYRTGCLVNTRLFTGRGRRKALRSHYYDNVTTNRGENASLVGPRRWRNTRGCSVPTVKRSHGPPRPWS